ncbi:MULTISPECIES: divalent metal cation transporter [Anabaena]|uniref:divalent metal cation transporter n=1 Tax=Anabaena TaxID=1163 RepID=UPI0005A5E021|nr:MULTISPECIES: divalent metal cation transporter [Anabaena]MCM2405528.1 divalent metal cation transporter [Anabaena sp. CCAP 1446/1C]BAY06550.1 manganese transport protein [Anabaena cylindrica PCC 7122]
MAGFLNYFNFSYEDFACFSCTTLARNSPLALAIALQLLFVIPLVWGVCITALDVLVLLFLQHKGFRHTEALVIILVATVGICFTAEILFSRPDMRGILLGYLPKKEILQNPEMLYIVIGILGATVMPHQQFSFWTETHLS